MDYTTALQSLFGTGLIYKLAMSIILLFIFYAIIQIINRSIDALTKELTAGKSSYEYRKAIIHYSKPLKLVVKIALGVVIIISLLSLFGVKGAVVGMLSAAGFAGIVVGFAAKDILSDFIAGIVIFIDKPFIKS